MAYVPRSALFVFVTLGFLGPAIVQAAEDDIGIWAIFSTTDTWPGEQSDSPWLYWFDAQARFPDVGSGANQFLVRPAVGYQPGENIQFWLGYARLRSESAAGSVVDENRWWQQANWSAGRIADGNVSMRIRVEQRVLSTGDDFGLVARFMAKYSRPIGKDGSKSLIIGVEPFFNLRDTDWGAESGITQQRTSLGVGWRVNAKLSLEASYMNQYIFRDSAADVSNHLAVVNFKVKF